LNIFIIFFLVLANGAGATFVIDDVPFVRQETQYCGPAALSSVLSYYGDDVDQKTIGKEVHSPGLRGALITDLENYSRKRGFQTKIGRASTADIKEFLLNNKPVIVLVDIGFWVISRMHYLVVYGYTDRGFWSMMVLNRPGCTLTRNLRRYGKKPANSFFTCLPVTIWLLVMLPSACTFPRIVMIEDTLTAEQHNDLGYVYEQKQAYELAEKEYLLAVKKREVWPVPYFNLGNLAYKTGNYTKSEDFSVKC